MIVVDASCLIEVLIGAPSAPAVREHLATDPDHAAPHIIDGEVLGFLRREHLRGTLDATAAGLAVEDLRDWPGTRFPQAPLLNRAWELRSSVSAWDALYVALAETLGVALLTTDQRLTRAHGPRCQFTVVAS